MGAQFDPNTKIVLGFKATEGLTEHLSVHNESEDAIYCTYSIKLCSDEILYSEGQPVSLQTEKTPVQQIV